LKATLTVKTAPTMRLERAKEGRREKKVEAIDISPKSGSRQMVANLTPRQIFQSIDYGQGDIKHGIRF
jgi:hypothetical protein